MTSADLPLAALRLNPLTERALVRRGITTAGQLAAHTQSSLHQLGVSWRMAGKIGAALQERGLDLRPGRSYSRKQQPATKPAAAARAAPAKQPAAKPAPAPAAPAPAAPPPAPAIPPLPKIGRVQVRAAAPQPRTWSWTPPRFGTLRGVARRMRASLARTLIRIGERIAP